MIYVRRLITILFLRNLIVFSVEMDDQADLEYQKFEKRHVRQVIFDKPSIVNREIGDNSQLPDVPPTATHQEFNVIDHWYPTPAAPSTATRRPFHAKVGVTVRLLKASKVDDENQDNQEDPFKTVDVASSARPTRRVPIARTSAQTTAAPPTTIDTEGDAFFAGRTAVTQSPHALRIAVKNTQPHDPSDVFLQCCKSNADIMHGCYQYCNYESFTHDRLTLMYNDPQCGATNIPGLLVCASKEMDNIQCCMKKGIGVSSKALANVGEPQLPPTCINFCKRSVALSTKNLGPQYIPCLGALDQYRQCYESGVQRAIDKGIL